MVLGIWVRDWSGQRKNYFLLSPNSLSSDKLYHYFWIFACWVFGLTRNGLDFANRGRCCKTHNYDYVMIWHICKVKYIWNFRMSCSLFSEVKHREMIIKIGTCHGAFCWNLFEMCSNLKIIARENATSIVFEGLDNSTEMFACNSRHLCFTIRFCIIDLV
jgi:hypothetical protein